MARVATRNTGRALLRRFGIFTGLSLRADEAESIALPLAPKPGDTIGTRSMEPGPAISAAA